MIGKKVVVVVCLAFGFTLFAQEAFRASAPTVADDEAGLVWMADAGYAVTSGYAADPIMKRSDGLRFVAAINAGTLDNFGFTDWRLPTVRELRRIMEREAQGKIAGPMENISMARSWMQRTNGWSSRTARVSEAEPGVFAWPVRGAAVEPGFSEVVVFATNSIDIDNGVVIHSGDLVVNDASPGPTLASNVELNIGKVEIASTVASDYRFLTVATAQLKADSIKIQNQAVVNGDVSYNDLQNNGTVNGMLITPLTLPVFTLLPPFPTQVPPPGAPDVTVPTGGSASLLAGDYGHLVVGDGATLTFLGGAYTVRSITAGVGSRLNFEAAAKVVVEGRFLTLQNSFVGGAPGFGLLARQVIFFVAGINGATGALGEEPKAADIGRLNTVQANFYVPNGGIRIRRDTQATGAFLGRDVRVENSSQVHLDSFYTNDPPDAVDDAVSISEGGTVSIDVLANDSDPNNDNLILTPTVFNGPSHGTAVQDGPTSFFYSHDGSETLSDSFDYEVCDDGVPVRCSTATVNITVVPSNDAPTPQDDSFGPVPEGGVAASAPFSVLANDTDPEDDNLTVTSGLLRTAFGDISFNADGTFVYRHFGSENFFDSAVYEVCDDGLPERCANATLSISIAPVNDPPTANPQSVQLPGQDVEDGGAGPSNTLDIVLTGSDPEGDSLVFSIFSGPGNGSVGAVTPIDATSAMVTYTSNDPFMSDSFVFQVDDQQGGTDTATVNIAAAPGVPIAGVQANDRIAEVNQNTPTSIRISGDAPDGVALSFSVVAGPDVGAVSALTPGTEVPQRSATLTYTPANSYRGPDSFTFEACGEINTNTVCAQGMVSITVLGTLAANQQISTFGNLPLQIDLSGEPIAAPDTGGGTSPPPDPRAQRRFTPQPGGVSLATTLVPVAIAGAVSDSNGDGIGDEANDLPGGAPVFASAAVDSSGGPGVNGVVRFHMEWALAEIPTLGAADRAIVKLNTNRGTIDVLDTFFFAGESNSDGELTAFDFQTPLAAVPGVVMPVPDVPVGTDGTFFVDITSQVRAAQSASLSSHIVVQGRVDEGLAGGGFKRGLQMRTSADGNVTAGTQPQLQIQQVVYAITALPSNGTLKDSTGAPVMTAGQTLPSRIVTYTPNPGYLGPDGFSFSATLNQLVEFAAVDLVVVVGTCEDNVVFCEDGRSGN